MKVKNSTSAGQNYKKCQRTYLRTKEKKKNTNLNLCAETKALEMINIWANTDFFPFLF